MNSIDLPRLIWSAAGLAVSIGFLAVVWKLAWATRGYVEAMKERAKNETKILVTLDSLVELQKQSLEAQNRMIARAHEMEEKMWTAIGVHTLRLNSMVETVSLLKGEPS